MGRLLLNKVPFVEAQFTKHCNGCNRDLPRDHFYRNVKGGLISRCKECCAKYQASYRDKKKKQKQISWYVDY